MEQELMHDLGNNHMKVMRQLLFHLQQMPPPSEQKRYLLMVTRANLFNDRAGPVFGEQHVMAGSAAVLFSMRGYFVNFRPLEVNKDDLESS